MEFGNVFFVATKSPQLKVHHSPEPNPEAGKRLRTAESERDAYAVWNEWYAAAKGVGPFFSEHPQVQMEMALMWKGRREFDASRGQLLLDDFNPVEFYDARNREENRRGLIHQIDPGNG